MQLNNSRNQQVIDSYYDYSGAITTGGVAQLLLPQRKSCSHLIICNNSSQPLYIQFGVRPATALLTNGVVTSVTVNDAGFGFLAPPDVMFFGGGNSNDPASYGATMPDWPPPAAPAIGRALMSAGAISSIEVNYGGSGYLVAPYVFIRAQRTDPTGVGIPSATTGLPIQANGGSYYVNGTACPTDAIAIYGGTTGQRYVVKWMS